MESGPDGESVNTSVDQRLIQGKQGGCVCCHSAFLQQWGPRLSPWAFFHLSLALSQGSSTRRNPFPPRHMWQLESLLLIVTGVGCYWPLVYRGQGAARHGTAPHSKDPAGPKKQGRNPGPGSGSDLSCGAESNCCAPYTAD